MLLNRYEAMPELAELATRRAPPPSGRAEVQHARARKVVLFESSSGSSFEAELAAAGYDDPRAGDIVVYFTDASEHRYVVGVLSAPRGELEAMLDAPRRVHDEHGRLLFEYDPETKRATLHVPDGDLDVAIPGGALRLSARDSIVIESEGPVVASSAQKVELETRPGGEQPARVTVERGEVSLVAGALTMAAQRAQILANRLGLRGQALETHFERARHAAEVIDTRATRLVERARDAYREVERLSQHHAGRLKLVAETTASLVAEDAILKARDRMKIKGERIHLA